MKQNVIQTRVQLFSFHSIRYNEAKHEKDDSSRGSINADELKQFQKLSQEWWQENGEFEPLHRYNELRVPWIKNTLFNINRQTLVNENSNAIHLKEPLLGLNILGLNFLI